MIAATVATISAVVGQTRAVPVRNRSNGKYITNRVANRLWLASRVKRL
jgi:hypothetical protein